MRFAFPFFRKQPCHALPTSGTVHAYKVSSVPKTEHGLDGPPRKFAIQHMKLYGINRADTFALADEMHGARVGMRPCACFLSALGGLDIMCPPCPQV